MKKPGLLIMLLVSLIFVVATALVPAAYGKTNVPDSGNVDPGRPSPGPYDPVIYPTVYPATDTMCPEIPTECPVVREQGATCEVTVYPQEATICPEVETTCGVVPTDDPTGIAKDGFSALARRATELAS